MFKYFNSITLYKWIMTDKEISKLEENIKKLEWTKLLIIHLIITLIYSFANYISSKNNPLTTNSDFLTFLFVFIFNFSSGFLFLFGGYYFSKLFFKTKLSVTDFYTALIYLYLPVFTLNTLIALLQMGLSFIDHIYFYIVFLNLGIPLLYYIFKALNTAMFIFKKEFNTNNLPLIGVVILWNFLTILIILLILFLFFLLLEPPELSFIDFLLILKIY